MSQKLEIAEFLPDIELPSVQMGVLVPLRPLNGRSTVLVSMHSGACETCRRYIGELASRSAEFNVWDARLLIIVPGPSVAGEHLRPSFGTVLADTEYRVSTPGEAAAVVADRYGQVFEARHAGGSHRLPSPRQIEEWLKFLGTLCPE